MATTNTTANIWLWNFRNSNNFMHFTPLCVVEKQQTGFFKWRYEVVWVSERVHWKIPNQTQQQFAVDFSVEKGSTCCWNVRISRHRPCVDEKVGERKRHKNIFWNSAPLHSLNWHSHRPHRTRGRDYSLQQKKRSKQEEEIDFQSFFTYQLQHQRSKRERTRENPIFSQLPDM